MRVSLDSDGRVMDVDWLGDRAVVKGGGAGLEDVSVETVAPGEYRLTIDRDGPDRREVRAHAIRIGDRVQVQIDGQLFEFWRSRGASGARAGGPPDASTAELRAPMPATVVKVLVRAGDAVRTGDTLVTLEAMKMELPLRAPRDGMVKAVCCAEGDLVQAGERLAELD